MDDPLWKSTDAYLAEHLAPPDDALRSALEANARAGLPAIDVSPLQGKLLHLLALAIGARRVLEIGTLGGYSTIWLARALPPGGRLVTLEVDPAHGAVARENLERAGLSRVVELRLGPAAETLSRLKAEGYGPFDLIFIDADKPSNADYVRWALELSRPGTIIIVDNVVRGGAVADPDSTDPRVIGSRRLVEFLAAEARLCATAIQTVGGKGYDGFAIAIVGRGSTESR
jgi:predicted O-methyltransferase YrrM